MESYASLWGEMNRTTNERLLDSPLTPEEYRELADELDRTDGTLRVTGFDQELARLEFLEWFPRLRRISISGLHYTRDLASLAYLPADLEYLDLGETQKPLDLLPVADRFSGLREIRVVGHRRNLSRLIEANSGVVALSLWRLPINDVVPEPSLPRLESLAITLGSLRDTRWLAQRSRLRFLALRGIKGVTDVNVLNELAALEWLWLDSLSGIDKIPDLRANLRLVRVDLTEMRGLRASDALRGVAEAPRLEELLVSESRLPVEAFRPFQQHPSLKRVGVGLGSSRRNDEVATMLSLPPQSSLHEFAEELGIRFMT